MLTKFSHVYISAQTFTFYEESLQRGGDRASLSAGFLETFSDGNILKISCGKPPRLRMHTDEATKLRMLTHTSMPNVYFVKDMTGTIGLYQTQWPVPQTMNNGQQYDPLVRETLRNKHATPAYGGQPLGTPNGNQSRLVENSYELELVAPLNIAVVKAMSRLGAHSGIHGVVEWLMKNELNICTTYVQTVTLERIKACKNLNTAISMLVDAGLCANIDLSVVSKVERTTVACDPWYDVKQNTENKIMLYKATNVENCKPGTYRDPYKVYIKIDSKKGTITSALDLLDTVTLLVSDFGKPKSAEVINALFSKDAISMDEYMSILARFDELRLEDSLPGLADDGMHHVLDIYVHYVKLHDGTITIKSSPMLVGNVEPH